MLTYAGAAGHAFIGHRLYLPKRWTPERGHLLPRPRPVQHADLRYNTMTSADTPAGDQVTGLGKAAQHRLVRRAPTD